MSYSVHKNLIIRYIENAKKEFNKEWLAGNYDGASWDQRDYITRRLTDYNCYIEWKKNKTTNPFTNRKIKEENAIYKEFKKLCSILADKEKPKK